ncbi:MAG: major capsid protein [Microviridae sp.]|nr:MAG: major capsid protein [Microviridae sp.]
MHRNQSVNTHKFAMVPRADIPRSGFKIETTHKTTLDAGYLYPIYLTEILPGDSFNLKATIFARLATPIVPIMDNLYLETFFFFVPNRLVWSNWVKFMGEQKSPGDTISYTIPQITSPTNGHARASIYDYFGIPCAGQIGLGNVISHSALPLRAYYLIWTEWFRDENLQAGGTLNIGNGPDTASFYNLLRRGKRHDYFTSCLPWVQKGTSVSLPLGTSATVKTAGSALVTGAHPALVFSQAADGSAPAGNYLTGVNAAGTLARTTGMAGETLNQVMYPNNLYADLSTATAATINQIRQAFQIQKLLERDARGGTRYTELVKSHFGVISPDARLQRPEYLGGGTTPISIREVPQTQSTEAGTTPQGNLAGVGTATAHGHGFTQSFTEHGHVIGLASIRADLTYQQGLRKLWSRKTRYDFYFPVFAMLGEQAVLNKEIYAKGDANDDLVFGYQERWAEYRYQPSLTTSYMNSSATAPVDVWHLAQKFTTLPVLNSSFIIDNPPIDRVIATTDITGQQFIVDAFFKINAARPLPMYSVPGLVDHF